MKSRLQTWQLRAFLIFLALGGTAGLVRAEATADRKAVVMRSRELLAEAHAVFSRGQADSAVALLDEVIAQDAANPDAFYLKGVIKLSCADTAGAEASLVEGARLAPLSRRLKLLLARVKIATGETGEAEEVVNEVMALRPHDVEGLYLRGLIALARADTMGAITIWESTLAEELRGGR